MIRLYAGFDEREAVGLHVFVSSVLERASQPVSICSLTAKALGEQQRDGSNNFTYSRFLIPWLQDFRGMAIFADGADMLCLADIAQLADLFDRRFAVQVVKHDYKTKCARKYIGTPMEADNADYPRKNWSSLMLINCEHKAWRQMTPDRVGVMPGSWAHRFEFLEPARAEYEARVPSLIGELPAQWNFLVGEQAKAPAAIAHFTLGIPAFEHYKDCDYAAEWRVQLEKVNAHV